MIRILRQTFNTFLRVLLVILTLVYLGSYIIEFFTYRSLDLEQSFIGFRIFIILFFSGIYGFFRVWSFHPVFNIRYRQWLALTPWQYGKPLPVGPVHLVWIDLIIVGLLTLLAYSVDGYFLVYPAGLFLACNLFCHLLAFTLNRQTDFAWILLFAAPLTIYPFGDSRIALVVLVVLYVWCGLGLRKYLKGFPWESEFWKAIPRKYQLMRYFRNGVIGWPHGKLNTVEHEMSISLGWAAVISGLLTWWLHVFVELAGEPKYYISLILCIFPVCVVARIGAYIYPYWPPINVWGRIFTFRWIIPRYDKIFIAPLIVVLTAVFPLLLYGRDCGHMGGLMKKTFFLIIFLTLALPPKLKSWRLTGHYRLLKYASRQGPVRAKKDLSQDLILLINQGR